MTCHKTTAINDPYLHAQQLLKLIKSDAPLSQQQVIQRKLARAFGKQYGWALSRSSFELQALASRKVDSKHITRNRFPTGYPYVDHAYYYRAPLTNRPVAMAVHLYDVPDDMEHWSLYFGLRHTVIQDFPSWWYPKKTKLVLIQGKSLDGPVSDS